VSACRRIEPAHVSHTPTRPYADPPTRRPADTFPSQLSPFKPLQDVQRLD
jgi:hypothetical protein